MKINGFQVEEHGEGYSVTIRLHIGREELPETLISEPLDAIIKLLAGDTVAPAEDKPKPRRRSKPEDTPDTKPEDAPAAKTRRRSKKTEEAKTAPAEEAKTAPTGRRARRLASGASNAQPKEAEKSEVDPTDTPAPSETAKTAGKRSRRAKPSGAKPASTKKSRSKKDDVSDEDLTKAASQAAALLGPPAVMDVLDEFAVEEVRDLSQEQRKEFMAKLDDAKEAAA